MIGVSILELQEANATDESVKSYEYDEYQPITGTQFNSAGQITITIENQDQFLHLHNRYLLIEGDVLKADNTRFSDADLIAHTNIVSIFQFDVNIGWTNGGTCQLSWSGYITSRFSELLVNILQRMWTGTRLVSRYQH